MGEHEKIFYITLRKRLKKFERLWGVGGEEGIDFK
jgi:hypothetical protein